MTNFEKIKSMSEEEFLRCIMICPNEFNYIGSEAWCKKKCSLERSCADCCREWLQDEFKDPT